MFCICTLYFVLIFIILFLNIDVNLIVCFYQAVLEALRQSSESRQWVKVDLNKLSFPKDYQWVKVDLKNYLFP